jgi:predicted amidophosphoribosyltransferase
MAGRRAYPPGMSLIGVVRGVLRPPVCLACAAPGGWPCCPRCLPPASGAVGPWPLAADPEVALWALGPYRDGLRSAVLAGKLAGQAAALAELGRRLGIALAAAGIGADLVTWVATGRVAGPPRDHAERIAAGVAAALELPLVGLLAPASGRDLGRARRAQRARRPRAATAVASATDGPAPPGRRPGPARRRPGHHRRHPRRRRRHPPPGRGPAGRRRRPGRRPDRPPGGPGRGVGGWPGCLEVGV